MDDIKIPNSLAIGILLALFIDWLRQRWERYQYKQGDETVLEVGEAVCLAVDNLQLRGYVTSLEIDGEVGKVEVRPAQDGGVGVWMPDQK
jgi:hypothetical protein